MRRFFTLIILASLFSLALFLPAHAAPEDLYNPEAPIALPPDQFFRGVVTKIITEDAADELGAAMRLQRVSLKIISGPEKNKEVSADYGFRDDANANRKRLLVGTKVVVGKNVSPVGTLYYVSELYRLDALWWIGGIFVALIMLFGRKRGVLSFAGLVVSLLVIAYYIVPSLAAGKNPLLVSLLGSAAISVVSLYLAHGFKKRTTVALVSTLATIGIATAIATLFVSLSKIFGLGTEGAFELQFAPFPNINLRGLLLAGIIIGTLGILDDITTAQSAAVEELHLANPTLNRHELFKRGLSIGREHISALVNTLVLAYAGAGLPLFLLFKAYPGTPGWVTLNSEFVVEEIVRTLVGSTTLVIAVPLTTFLAAIVFSRQHTP